MFGTPDVEFALVIDPIDKKTVLTHGKHVVAFPYHEACAIAVEVTNKAARYTLDGIRAGLGARGNSQQRCQQLDQKRD
jgi:hypothetical protein